MNVARYILAVGSEIADAGGEPLVELVIVPDGETHSSSGAWVLDAEGAAEILARFAEKRTDLVFDYEHQTLGGEYASPTGKAPAAGWIKNLRYEPGRGLVAAVAWTEQARLEIRARQYRYCSPVVLVRKADNRAIALHSVALTNKPAIAGMLPVAAKELGDGAPRNQEGSRTVAPGETLTDGATEILIMKDLKELLIRLKAPLPDNPDDAAVEKAAIATLEGLSKSLVEQVAAKDAELKRIAAAAGVAEPQTELIVAAVTKLHADRVPSSELVALRERVEQYEGREKTRQAEGIVAAAVAAGKIVKGDEAYWLTVAKADPQAAEQHLAHMQVVVPQGKFSAPKGGADGKPAREIVIAKAKADHAANPELRAFSLRGFVGEKLRAAGLAALTKAEEAVLAA